MAANGRQGRQSEERGESGDGSGSSGSSGGSGDQSTGTVLLAMVANAVIALGKIVVGAATGSSAMLSEGAHSVADTLNEGFLLAALKRSRRRPDAQHPFGYGKERFFWSLIAAVGIFVAGAGFSFVQAYEALTGSGGDDGSYLWAYLMLAVAAVLEGVSWARAVWQTRREAQERRKGVIQHVRESADPTVKTVASEDTAALVGLALAFGGLALHQATGHVQWEGVASLLIALLLVVVAYALARDAKGLLIGEAADEATRDRICELLTGHDGVQEVIEVLTMRVGSDQVLVAVRLDFRADLTADEITGLSSRIDRDLHEQVPEVYQVFLDATDAGTRARDRYPAGASRIGQDAAARRRA
ncbi:MAG: cation diffusion facilitator family transporter [Frankiaceae bacterium]